MGDEFELEHWKSRATIAERERDSARFVLATLRGFVRACLDGKSTGDTFAKLRKAQQEHDRQWWTREHAMNAVGEFIAGIDESEQLEPTK